MTHNIKSCSILDLPHEVLRIIFELTKPNFEEIVLLASVCKAFRSAAFEVAVGVHIPVNEDKLEILRRYQIPVSTLANRSLALFVGYQFKALNLRRLTTAELACDDYLTPTASTLLGGGVQRAKGSRGRLSPHYLDILSRLSEQCSVSLRHLIVYMDLERSYDGNGFRCGEIVTSFKNLTFLSMSFNETIELRQKLERRSDARSLIRSVLGQLKRLKTLYLFHCPGDDLVIESDTLERLHIYKSEFAAVHTIKTPNLTKIVFHGGILEFFRKIRSRDEDAAKKAKIFSVLYEGAPKLAVFNQVDVRGLRRMRDDWSKDRWSHEALTLCLKHYMRQHGELSHAY